MLVPHADFQTEGPQPMEGIVSYVDYFFVISIV